MLSSSDLSHEHLYLINPFDHQEVNQQQFFQQQYHQCYYQPPLTDFTHTYNNINTNFQTLSNQIFSAAYSGIQVFEMLCEGIAVMRRRADSYLNATQILKVAGIDKGKRTKILEKEISQGEHEKVQGGYGKYQGTWIPYERGVDLARQYYVIDLLKPILEFDPPIPGVKPTFNNRECLPKVKVYNTKEKDSKEISISKKRKQTVKDAKESNIELPKKQKKSYYEKKKKVDSQLQAPPLKSAHKVQKIRALAKSNEQQNVRQNLKQPVNQISTPSIILNENTYQYPNQGILIEQEELYRPERYKEDLMALFLNENAVFPDFLKNPNPPADLDVDLLIDEQGHTSLHWASALAKTVLLSLLISKKAQINARNFSGESALIRSVLVTNNYNLQTFPIVLELLHTSLYLEDNQNQNVLHHIALLDASEKVEAGKYYMECILEYIARNENGNFNKLVNAQNKSGDTPLIIAARMGHKNYVEQLLEAGADISLENRSGLGPKDFGLDYFFGYNELKYHDELIVECNHDDSNSLNFPLDGFMSNTGILPEQYLEEHNYFLQANAFCLNEVDLKQNYQLYNNSTFNSSPPVKFVFPISKTDEATHSSFKPISLISDNLNESNENEGTRRKLNGNPNKINDEFYNLHNPVLGQEFNDKSYIETELEFTKAHFEDTVIDSFFLDSVLNTFENDKDIGVADISSFLVEVRKQEEKSCIKECDLEKQ
ncbi:transcriptional regulator swi6 [Clydaea vesicula]|uniref:Transcriptional regulator swi6 n=1 Tax=Clydaea vesicula TaxID=447962 RepID=A0AAD5U517_9FUNG|nr:transcriptional regulator swi6 [Clydaea vesicula]